MNSLDMPLIDGEMETMYLVAPDKGYVVRERFHDSNTKVLY